MNEVSKVYSLKNTAVLFMVFNRPNTTSKVFETIRKAKPPRLYVAADGPRKDKEGEENKILKVREIATAVDWPCKVKTLFRKKNLGCKSATSSAITWFFENEEQGIILEDDDLPNKDFFYFCEFLLNYYLDNKEILTISGNNFQDGNKRGDASYYFSKYFQCWGWAGWRRSWNYYDGELSFWPKWKYSEDWKKKLPKKVERKYWEKIFDLNYNKKINSMAYPFTASLWYHGGVNIVPNVNLVSNIGFGEEATHTKSKKDYGNNVPSKTLGNIIHPTSIKINLEADNYDFNWLFGGRNLTFPRNLMIFFYSRLSLIYKKIKKILR